MKIISLSLKTDKPQIMRNDEAEHRELLKGRFVGERIDKWAEMNPGKGISNEELRTIFLQADKDV